MPMISALRDGDLCTVHCFKILKRTIRRSASIHPNVRLIIARNSVCTCIYVYICICIYICDNTFGG